MVADVDIGFRLDIFPADDLIGNTIEFAECPGPEFEEFITDVTVLFSQQEGNKNAGQIEYHEHGENR